jgi:dTDP-4-dehydrorhamnose 3,5-epimerase
VAAELTSESDTQLWIPEGFAHGFCTLTPDTEVWYAVTSVYSPTHEGGILWNDPDLGIAWPVAPEAATIGARDVVQPRFRDHVSDFA